MAVDLRSLQLHQPPPLYRELRGPDPFLSTCATALSAGCLHGSALRSGRVSDCLSHKMQLNLMKMFILKYDFDTFAQHINSFSRWHFVKLKNV